MRFRVRVRARVRVRSRSSWVPSSLSGDEADSLVTG